ncbi:hypothetical protein NB640_01565 [Oxalobacter vibrioformis]|uniref:TolA protein n=1 Tax=Oxalobacter vibrioformis TaxID=933080 RepID=A0A9E9P4R0_9BURK|nr:hypothetical protein [Oxalobacter vibrioformis]WAW10381.1 hypothetical protein NB640_01565 [Oxalobacter vibrioformis]
MMTDVRSGLASLLQQGGNARDKFNSKPKNLRESGAPAFDKTKDSAGKQGVIGSSKAAVGNINNMKSMATNARKMAASMRIEMLKQRIEGLQRMAGTVKISPREIARLARELKDAIAQYRSAGGEGQRASAAPAAAGAPAQQTDTGEAEAGSAIDIADNPVEASVTASVDASMADAAAVAAATTSMVAADETVQQVEETPVDGNASASADPSVAAQPGQAANPDEQQQADKTSPSPSPLAKKLSAYQKNDPDADFMAKAKQLADKIRALMRQVKAQDKADKEEIRKAKRDLDEVEKAIAESQKTSGAGNMTALKGVVAEVADDLQLVVESVNMASMSSDSALYDASGANSSFDTGSHISLSV